MSNHSIASTDLVSFNCFLTVLYYNCVVFRNNEIASVIRGKCKLLSKYRCGSTRCSLNRSVLGCTSACKRIGCHNSNINMTMKEMICEGYKGDMEEIIRLMKSYLYFHHTLFLLYCMFFLYNAILS